jgi:hypothetical protein
MGGKGSEFGPEAWDRLRRFQERAAAVAASELAQRVDLATLGSTMKILVRVGEPQVEWTREMPSEAVIEQAAARVRPIVLTEDSVYWGKVTSALGYLTKNSSQMSKDLVKAIKEAWTAFDEQRTWAMEVRKIDDPTETSGVLWDRDIAKSWLYGDLVHADPAAQDKIRLISSDDRLWAGLLWVKDAVLLIRATQQTIIDLEDSGELVS